MTKEDKTLRKAALTFRAINHDLRRAIINLLREKKELMVMDIYVKLRIEQSVASQHLAILRRAGIVKANKKGKFVFYSLDENKISTILSVASKLAV